MDVTPLIVPTMTALSTFLAGAADGAAHKLGEAAVEQSKRIYDAVKARFQKEADGGQASQMLTLFEQNQKLRPAVEAELERILRADPAFVEQLRQLFRSGPIQVIEMGDDAEGEIEQTNRARAGAQEVHGGERSRIKAKQQIE